MDEYKYYTDSTAVFRRNGGLWNPSSPLEIYRDHKWVTYRYKENIFTTFREIDPKKARELIAKQIAM